MSIALTNYIFEFHLYDINIEKNKTYSKGDQLLMFFLLTMSKCYNLKIYRMTICFIVNFSHKKTVTHFKMSNFTTQNIRNSLGITPLI